MADFIGLFNFEWYGQNKVGNIEILVLRRDHENSIYKQEMVIFELFISTFNRSRKMVERRVFE